MSPCLQLKAKFVFPETALNGADIRGMEATEEETEGQETKFGFTPERQEWREKDVLLFHSYIHRKMGRIEKISLLGAKNKHVRALSLTTTAVRVRVCVCFRGHWRFHSGR